MKKKGEPYWLLCSLLLLLVCLCCSGCDNGNDTKEEVTASDISTADNIIYIVSSSKQTMQDWDGGFGAITADGRLVLPFTNKQIEIIYDNKTKAQLWLQTKQFLLTDGAHMGDELLEDYYDGLLSNKKWQYFQNQYQLYDLEGSLLQTSSQRAVQAVYGDLILYNDGKLESRQTGTVYFDDVYDFYYADGYFIMNCDDETRIVDENLQVLQELAGNGRVEGAYILLWRDGYTGLFSLDGQELLPCQYDFIQILENGTQCLACAYKDAYSIVDLTDKSLRYSVDAKEATLYYADDELVLLRNEQDQTCQMYNYSGKALSAVYEHIYSALEVELPEGEEEPFFIARTFDGKEVLLNRQGKVVYESTKGQWLSLINEDRLVVNDNETASLQDLKGNIKNKKSYEGIYAEYAASERDGAMHKLPLVTGRYAYGNSQLSDLLDLDGNILVEQAKYICPLSLNRFWVEKGFTQGLMDESGRWLYQQSLFDSAIDE